MTDELVSEYVHGLECLVFIVWSLPIPSFLFHLCFSVCVSLYVSLSASLCLSLCVSLWVSLHFSLCISPYLSVSRPLRSGHVKSATPLFPDMIVSLAF